MIKGTDVRKQICHAHTLHGSRMCRNFCIACGNIDHAVADWCFLFLLLLLLLMLLLLLYGCNWGRGDHYLDA